MPRIMTAVLLSFMLGSSLPAGAAANTAVAVPGSFLAGYATPVLALSKSVPATFANLDIAEHDVRSVATRPNSMPWFSTPVIDGGQTATIEGLSTTPDGVYEFFCIVHPTRMRGFAVVTP